MTLKDKEDDLFEEWSKSKSCYSKQFAKDGVADEKYYNKAKYKILFLAKETNNTNHTWDTREYLNEGMFYRSTGKPISRTFNNIYRWANLFLNTLDNINEYKKVPKKKSPRQKIFASIAMMNLKKTTGKAVTVNDELSIFINNNKEFIKKQILLYEPQIIICCGKGVYNGYKKVMLDCQDENKENGKFRTSLYVNNNIETIVIDFYHPQSRIKIKEQYEILQKIRKQYKL